MLLTSNHAKARTGNPGPVIPKLSFLIPTHQQKFKIGSQIPAVGCTHRKQEHTFLFATLIYHFFNKTSILILIYQYQQSVLKQYTL